MLDRSVFTALDDPVDFPFEYHPPLVVVVAVVVVFLSRILVDDDAAHVVGQDYGAGPGGRTHFAFNGLKVDVVEGSVEYWIIE